MAEDLVEKIEEELQQKDDDLKHTKLETPLEEVQRVSTETKKIAEENTKLVERMEALQVEMSLSGKAMAGQAPLKEKTQDDIDQEDANKIVEQFI